jgi:hypothetical protein
MKGKTILICPLDWGLGHASRCIPLIYALKQAGYKILIGADKGPAALLKLEFPELTHLVFPGLEIVYPENGNFVSYMMKTAPKLIKQIKAEQTWVNRIVQEQGVDIVLSDNRYGARSKMAHSIFMTHQLFVRGTSYTRFLEPLMRVLTWQHIRKFDACWIPDLQDNPNLSGELAHGNNLPIANTQYIGILSRFQGLLEEHPGFEPPELLAILSGPEPLRTILENKLIQQAEEIKQEILIIRGKPGQQNIEKPNRYVQTISHLPSRQLLYCLNHSKIVVCRSGYSTMMDLQFTPTPALLIPTPGQTEQEYLAKHYQDKGWYYSNSQSKLDLKADLPKVNKFRKFTHSIIQDKSMLSDLIQNI